VDLSSDRLLMNESLTVNIRGLQSSSYVMTNSMQQSPSCEAKRFSASQEIPRALRNPKVHYRIHNSPPYVAPKDQSDPKA
jgi:hypothetical protein